MNIRCPQCQTVFRVNPERIPAGGARARCARCSATFTVKPPPPAAAAVAPPAPAAAPRSAQPQAGFRPAPGRPPAPAPERRVAVPAGAPAAAARPAFEAGAQTDDTAQRSSPLGTRDPGARAERLARALVSDIVAYNPERRDRSLADGSLRAEFREEILKSWEEYVAQVGDSVARSTPYFRDALNRILAQGQQLF